jgi:hypothetical protein
MVMPLCGTFRYAGIVPDSESARESGRWKLKDQSGAAPVVKWGIFEFWKRDALRDNRLVGLRPTLRIADDRLILTASWRRRAQVRSAALELDRSLIERLQAGDVLTLVRTATADIGISLLRGGGLLWTAGAVTAVPLGQQIEVRGGPRQDFSKPGSHEPRVDTWVDVSQSGHASRLRTGEESTVGRYRVSVLRSFRYGLPGTYESVAISLDGEGLHEASIRSAQLLCRPNAGLELTAWWRV